MAETVWKISRCHSGRLSKMRILSWTKNFNPRCLLEISVPNVGVYVFHSFDCSSNKYEKSFTMRVALYGDNILVLLLKEKALKGQKSVGSIHLTHAHFVLRKMARKKAGEGHFHSGTYNWEQMGNILRERYFFPYKPVTGESVRNLGGCGDEWLLVQPGCLGNSVSVTGG